MKIETKSHPKCNPSV